MSVPAWAVEGIRKNASWVGKRYYASDEDRETAREIGALRKLAPVDPPGREATEYTDRVTGQKYWVVAQRLASGSSVSMMFPRIDGEAAIDGLKKAHVALPYVEVTP